MTRPIGWHKKVDSAGEECVSLEIWGSINLYKEAFDEHGLMKEMYATQLRNLLHDMRFGLESAYDEKVIKAAWETE